MCVCVYFFLVSFLYPSHPLIITHPPFLSSHRQCSYIPSSIKDTYNRLKNSKGVTRGKKKYWVTSAIQRGLCNGPDGIVFASSSGISGGSSRRTLNNDEDDDEDDDE